jgi:monoamine oxidase
MIMQRREFLKASALGALSLPAFSHAKASGSAKKIIVVGAGVAGAAAAQQLHAAGNEVVVVEARNRIGGRIHTNRDWGVPLELGANWISYAHDPKNLVWGLKNAAGIETQKTSYDDVKIYDADGDNLRRLRLFLFYKKFEKRKKPIIAELLRGNTDISVAQCIQEMFASEKLSTTGQVLLETIKSSYATDIGDDLTNISTLQYLVNEQEADDEHLVVNGYDRLVKLLLTGINVQLNQPVREIRTQSNRVEVVTDRTTLKGDYVLVTIPISILQQNKIIFTPPLPAGCRTKIQSRSYLEV